MPVAEPSSVNPEGLLPLGDGLALDDGGVVRIDGRQALPADVPLRYDLPKTHPLYGSKALRTVPAGWPDCTIDADGRLSPLVKD